MVDEREVVHVHEAAPVQPDPELGQGQGIHRLFQHPGLAQGVERREVVIDPPAVIGVVHGQLGDLAEILEIFRPPRVLRRQAGQEVGEAQRDLARQELVLAVEHRHAIEHQAPPILGQPHQQPLGLGLDAGLDSLVVRDLAIKRRGLGRPGGTRERRGQGHEDEHRPGQGRAAAGRAGLCDHRT